MVCAGLCTSGINDNARDENEFIHVISSYISDECRCNVPAEEYLNGRCNVRFFEERLQCLSCTLLHQGQYVVWLQHGCIVHLSAVGLKVFEIDLEVKVLVVVVLQ